MLRLSARRAGDDRVPSTALPVASLLTTLLRMTIRKHSIDEHSFIQRPVYNSRVPRMLDSTPRHLRVATVVWGAFFVLFASTLACANNWNAPEAQLAQKIAAVTGPGAVAVGFSNRSSLPKNEFDDIRRGLLSEMAALGLRFVPPEQAAATLQVTLSENLDSYVWIAEIRSGGGEFSAVMISLPRPEGASTAREAAPLIIRKTLLWSQDERVLDASVVDGNPSHLIVLEASKVSLYKLQDSRWQPEQTLAITHARPWPRDLRGRLVLRKDHLFDAYLPGVFCKSSAAGALTLTCRDSEDPWPIGVDPLSLNAFFAPARNFFPGVLVPGVGKQTTAPAFYTAAALPRENYILWLLAAVDGQIHLLDGVRDQVLVKTGWGSDIATVKSSCGLGWQVLADRGGEGSTDTVRAFEVADREPAPASPAIEFDGPITAMWTETGGTSAIAVAHNSETEKYEAYRLAIACGQ